MSSITRATATDASVTPREVVEAAQRGDEAAWGVIFDLQYSRLFRFFRARLASPEQAEDLASDVFLEAFRSAHKFHWQGKPFEAWLFGIAKHVLASYYRSKHAETTDAIDTEPAVRDEFIAVEIRDLLQRLPNEYQTALELRFIVGLSGTEAAEVMGRSHGAFRSLLFRAVRAFKDESDKGLEGATKRRLNSLDRNTNNQLPHGAVLGGGGSA